MLNIETIDYHGVFLKNNYIVKISLLHLPLFFIINRKLIWNLFLVKLTNNRNI